MYSLKDSLQGSLKRLGIEKKLREKRVVDLWNRLRYGDLIKHSQGAHFTNGILFVTVSSPVWSQQLLFLKVKWIEQINRELKGNYLKDIRFQCGIIKQEIEFQIEQDTLPAWEEIVLSGEDLAAVEKLTEVISEKEVREKFKTFFIKGKKLRQWRQKKGWKSCDLCFCLYPQEEKKCPFCSHEKEIKKMLLQDPWLTWEDCKKKIPSLTEVEYKEIKKRIIDHLWESLISASQNEAAENFNKERIKKWLICAQIYVILKTGLQLSSISGEIFSFVLGEKMAGLFSQFKNKLKEGA